jgi:hypothetical protein
MACGGDSLAPPTTGSITLRIVAGASASTATDAAPLSNVSVQGHLDAARVRVLGLTNRTVNLTPNASGFSGTVDGLPPGGYSVVVEGLVAGEVDYFGEVSGVQVAAGQNTSPTIAFKSFRADSVADLGPPTAGMTFTARWARVANAQSYRVEWDKNPAFAAVSFKDTTDTFTTVTVSDTGVYYVRVRAGNGWDPSGRASDAKSVRLVGTPPAIQNGAAANGLAGAAGSQRYFGVQVPAGQTQLSVAIAGGTGNGNLYVQFGSLPTSSTSTFCASIGGNPSQCTFSKPSSGTWYIMLQGVSAYSNTSLTAAYVSTAAPSNLAARPASLSEIDLSWADTATNEDGFRIERCAGAGCTTFAEIATVANVTAYANTGLPAATNYSYRVRAYNAAGTSAYSAPAPSTTPFVLQNGVAVSNLGTAMGSELYFAIQVPTGQSQLAVTLSGGTGDADLYVRSGIVPTALVWDCRPRLTGNAEQCNISNPSAGYWYVVLYGTAAFSGASLTATYAPLVPPTNLTATAASSSEIDLTWTDNATNEDGYRIEQCSGQGCATFTEIAVVGANVTSYQNVGLSAGTSYSYRVRAYSATSTSAYVGPATATTLPLLVFTMQPASVPVGRNVFPAANPIYPSVQVTARDAAGATVTSYNAPVTLTLGTNPCGATLSGGGPVVPASGVATFTSLTIDKVCNGYTLIATSNVLTSAPTGPFNISIPGDLNLDNVVDCLDQDILLKAWGATDRPPADINKDGIVDVKDLGILLSNYHGVLQLAFTGQPNNSTAKALISPPVQVTIQNGSGKTCGSATDNVTTAIGANPSGGTLSGTATVAAVNGVATFDNLSIDKSGTGYSLTASATGIASAASATFNIAPFGSAAKLGFVGQPANVDINTAISPPVRVAIEDAQGNVVTTSAASVTLDLGANPGSATLGGTRTVAAANGVASFPDLTVNVAASGYTLSATSTGLGSATSTAFTVVDPAAATKLAFVQQPTGTTAGSVIVPAVTVAIENRSGQTVTSDNSTVVSLSLASWPIGGTLRGTRTATVANGVATFNDLSDTVSGTYTLQATASGLTAGTSASYTISAGVATQLLFSSQPTNVEAGKVLPTVRVVVADVYGNTVTSATNSVTLCYGDAFYGPCANGGADASRAIKIGPGMKGTLTVAAASGVASFTDLRPRFTDLCAYCYYDPSLRSFPTYLVASAVGLNAASSSAYYVLPSVAAGVWAAVPNGTQTANVGFVVSAYVLDSLYNETRSGANVISLGLGNNAGGGSLTTANNLTATNGRADFNVSIDKGGKGYTLVASTAGLASLTSLPFDVAPFGAATRLAFGIQPTQTATGAPITPAVQVCVQDGVGNTVTTANNSITVALGANPGGATLGGTLIVGATNGCATFSDLTLSAAGHGYTLTAAASGLTGATSQAFDIGP